MSLNTIDRIVKRYLLQYPSLCNSRIGALTELFFGNGLSSDWVQNDKGEFFLVSEHDDLPYKTGKRPERTTSEVLDFDLGYDFDAHILDFIDKNIDRYCQSDFKSHWIDLTPKTFSRGYFFHPMERFPDGKIDKVTSEALAEVTTYWLHQLNPFKGYSKSYREALGMIRRSDQSTSGIYLKLLNIYEQHVERTEKEKMARINSFTERMMERKNNGFSESGLCDLMTEAEYKALAARSKSENDHSMPLNQWVKLVYRSETKYLTDGKPNEQFYRHCQARIEHYAGRSLSQYGFTSLVDDLRHNANIHGKVLNDALTLWAMDNVNGCIGAS